MHQRENAGGDRIALDDGLYGFPPGRPIGQAKIILGPPNSRLLGVYKRAVIGGALDEKFDIRGSAIH
jgi:hypothetical protein